MVFGPAAEVLALAALALCHRQTRHAGVGSFSSSAPAHHRAGPRPDCSFHQPKPMLDPMPNSSSQLEPFSPRVDLVAIEDLQARLRATRWPDAPGDVGWSLGTDVAYLRELVAYWAEGFDWPAQEAALARLPRFRMRLRGIGMVHFVHSRAASVGAPVLPLVFAMAGQTLSGGIRRSSHCSRTLEHTAPIQPTLLTWSCLTCRVSDTPTARAGRRSTPLPSLACGLS